MVILVFGVFCDLRTKGQDLISILTTFENCHYSYTYKLCQTCYVSIQYDQYSINVYTTDKTFKSMFNKYICCSEKEPKFIQRT